MVRASLWTAMLLFAGAASANPPVRYRPTPEQLAENYKRADQLSAEARRSVKNLRLEPRWLGDDRFWYLQENAEGEAYVLVESATGEKKPAFDHSRMAAALGTLRGRTVQPNNLQLRGVAITNDLKTLRFMESQTLYTCDLASFEIKRIDPTPPRSSDDTVIRVRDGQVEALLKEKWTKISTKGSFVTAFYTWDRKHALAFRVLPGDRKEALVLVSGAEGTRAQLQKQLYDQPGDKLDTYETWVIDVEKKLERKVAIEPIMGGGQPWAAPPVPQWWKKGSRALIRFPIRGYQQYKVLEIDPYNATAMTLVNETSPTFINTGQVRMELIQETNELIWLSERDGWAQLYLIDGNNGRVKNRITEGGFVVRSIERVDEKARQIWFTACGLEAGEDPYQIHLYRVNFDGTGMLLLTPGNGNHSLNWSPGRKYLVDTYSRVDEAPRHVLRAGDLGRQISVLETVSLEDWEKTGIQPVKPYVAKGRDGKTDIYGIVIRPSYWKESEKYPVIEYIYAGPHDSFVPKSFSPATAMHSLAELGFIVVQIDGMGTSNRGKAFHDVCWKNVGDAGFPDRIAWIKALAAEDSTLDLSGGVGIYGTSAGGQNSAGALLFHPEFYTVGVSSCGCHDNRIDKQWWNEQWMGYPVGPHYDEQSNITNAKKLRGKLMLILGEVDSNVPPESTFRLVDALQKANKDFEFVFLPGLGHTSGGAYGERKRRDYFVKWLLGVEPPAWQ